MPFVIYASVTIAALLCGWGARRDLQLPIWLTLGAFVISAFAAGYAFGASFTPLAALIIACILVVEADRRLQLIPDAFTAAIVALSFAVPFGDDGTTRLVGAMTLGATFFVMRQTCTALRGSEALGWGDVKFAAAMGGVLGPIYGFAAVAIAGMATLLVVVVRMRGGAVVLGAPFGVGLASATAIVAVARVLL